MTKHDTEHATVNNYVNEVQEHLEFLGYYEMMASHQDKAFMGRFAYNEFFRGYHSKLLPRETAQAIWDKAIATGTKQ